MIPPQFDEQFLAWFRRRTEKSWSLYELKDFDTDWQVWQDWFEGLSDQEVTEIEQYWHELRWLGGLSNQEITEIEQHWQLQFPPDYRLFLKTLHCMNKKIIGFDEECMGMKEYDDSTYSNWQTHQKEIEKKYEWIIEGMLFDVQNGIWRPGWGEEPITAKAQEARVRELVAAAPRIIPIVGNCYLLIEPCQSGNPVLSIQQTDIIVYSPDLYSFFLSEVSMRSPRRKLTAALKKRKEIWRERLPQYKTIPFWGEFV